ncbi:MAG: hypothetical protein K2P63_11140, partial [Lachnospiraceae bacterium]|nr:hypothetical protein [Lachnospiraceae bacterium]
MSQPQNPNPQQGQPQMPPQNQYPYQNPQNPYPYQNLQPMQNADVNLPEDNGSSGETSRFGSVWDRNVNGGRDNGNQNRDNRW